MIAAASLRHTYVSRRYLSILGLMTFQRLLNFPIMSYILREEPVIDKKQNANNCDFSVLGSVAIHFPVVMLTLLNTYVSAPLTQSSEVFFNLSRSKYRKRQLSRKLHRGSTSGNVTSFAKNHLSGTFKFPVYINLIKQKSSFLKTTNSLS